MNQYIIITLHYRYESWKNDGEGRTATIAFQKRHWFDTDITIRWLKWLQQQFPGKKIGLIWDHAPAHTNSIVNQFLQLASTWLTAVLIPGGLTSVLQVCDLIINKVFKQFARNGYYSWRTRFIKEKRLEGVSGKLKVKIPRDVLINIIEESIKKMNRLQQQKPTIRSMFQKAEQDPVVNCEEQFKMHLDSLQKNSMYKTIINNQQAVHLE